MKEAIKFMPEATGVPEVTPTTPTTDGEKSESQRAADWFKRARGETAQPKDYSGLSGWVRRDAEIRSAKSQLQVEEEYRRELKRLQKIRQSAGIPEVLPPAQPTPAVKPPEPGDYANQIARELGGIGAAGTEIKPPPEAKPNLAKVEVTNIIAEHIDSREVLLKINGKDLGMVWMQSKTADGKIVEGQFSLIDTKDAKGALEIPKGTRLFVYAQSIGSAVNITGGENTQIKLEDLKELGSNEDVIIVLQTSDLGNWEETSGAYEKEDGKANFIDGPDTNKKMTGASPEEAIAYLKKKLGQPAAGEVPTEPAKLSDKIQGDWLKHVGVDLEGRDSGPMEKGRQRRLALQRRFVSLAKLIDGVLAAPDAIGREISDRKREQVEQFRQIRDRAQEAWGKAEAKLMMTAEDLSSKTMGAVDKLTKAIGSNIVKALKVDRDAVISGWESAQADFEKGIENRPPRQTRADWNEAAAKRMEDRLSQMEEGDRGYDRLKRDAARARATGKRLRKKAEEDRARAEAARGSRKGMFSFLRKPSV